MTESNNTHQAIADDLAVDRFASAMKLKLAAARAKGRGGWDNPDLCTVEHLANLLVDHLGKDNAGTFEDIANFCMMLHQRGADPKTLAAVVKKRAARVGNVSGDVRAREVAAIVKYQSGGNVVHIVGDVKPGDLLFTALQPSGEAVAWEKVIDSIEHCPADENPSCSYADGWNECIRFIRGRIAYERTITPPAQVPDGLREAAKDFYNRTVGDRDVIIRCNSAEKRDDITASGELLRDMLTQPPKGIKND